MTTPKRIFLSGKAATLHITEEMNLLKMKTAKTVLLLSARPECSKTTRGHLDGTEGPGKSLNVDTSSCTTTCIPEVDEVSRHLMPMSARNSPSSRRACLDHLVLKTFKAVYTDPSKLFFSNNKLFSSKVNPADRVLHHEPLHVVCIETGVSSDPCKPQPNTRT
jgi:hypothetical protein